MKPWPDTPTLRRKKDRGTPSPMLQRSDVDESSRSPSRLAIQQSLPPLVSPSTSLKLSNRSFQWPLASPATVAASAFATASLSTSQSLQAEVRQTGLGVLGQLDAATRDRGAPFSPSEQYLRNSLRKLNHFEDKMSDRLHVYMDHENQRFMAIPNMLARERQSLIDRWSTVVVLQNATAILEKRIRLHRANETLKRLFLVKIVSFIQRKRATLQRNHQLSKRHENLKKAEQRRPWITTLRKVPCIAPLPDTAVELLCRSLVGLCFLAGESIVHQDVPGTGAYFLHDGTVMFLPRKEGKAKDPHHSRPEGAIGRPAAVSVIEQRRISEVGTCIAAEDLLTEEPQESTVHCMTDTDVWFLSRKNYLEVVAGLPQAQVEPIHRMIDERRERHMVRYNHLSEDTVRKSSPLFASWSIPGIRLLLQAVRPSIFRRGDTMIPRGSYGRQLIFLVWGRAEILREGDKHTKETREVIREGQAIGEGAAVTGRRDRVTSVRALTNCDCWILSRNDFSEVLCHESPLVILPPMMTLVDAAGRERPRKTAD